MDGLTFTDGRFCEKSIVGVGFDGCFLGGGFWNILVVYFFVAVVAA